MKRIFKVVFVVVFCFDVLGTANNTKGRNIMPDVFDKAILII